MDNRFPFTRIVRGLPATVPFVGPEALERRRGEPFRVRVGANESAFGISPLAREAMFRAVERLSWYNDPENHEIRSAIAGYHGVPFENVSVGSGIDDLLGLVVRVFVEPGREGRYIPGRIPDVQLPRKRVWRPPALRALPG